LKAPLVDVAPGPPARNQDPLKRSYGGPSLHFNKERLFFRLEKLSGQPALADDAHERSALQLRMERHWNCNGCFRRAFLHDTVASATANFKETVRL